MCAECNNHHDRDINESINLLKLAVSEAGISPATLVSSEVRWQRFALFNPSQRRKVLF
ncbi:hypothetical protein [Bacillus mycoides]|uniref:hypothetical protein n=1 Tax=Bacillus mycoides TaxID=1405 RepID=UPI0039BFAD46